MHTAESFIDLTERVDRYTVTSHTRPHYKLAPPPRSRPTGWSFTLELGFASLCTPGGPVSPPPAHRAPYGLNSTADDAVLWWAGSGTLVPEEVGVLRLCLDFDGVVDSVAYVTDELSLVAFEHRIQRKPREQRRRREEEGRGEREGMGGERRGEE